MGRQGARSGRLEFCTWLCLDSNYAHGRIAIAERVRDDGFALIPIMRMAESVEADADRPDGFALIPIMRMAEYASFVFCGEAALP